MRTRMIERELEVILEPADGPADAAVIWLHGLGADGYDFVPMIPELQLPAAARVRFLFPHAGVRPVTINGGYAMRAWYDIRDLTPAGREDEAGFAATRTRIGEYIARERATGIASTRIVLAGFSQGGAVALHVGLRHGETLAGILALSCYLPLPARLHAELSAANRTTPVLMCHGTEDAVVQMQFAELSRDAMREETLAVEWHSYPMGHSLCADEIGEIARWLRLRLVRSA
jgi:phospholipase/carboxylesterase